MTAPPRRSPEEAARWLSEFLCNNLERRINDDKRGLLQDLIESHRECGCDTVREIVEACRRPKVTE